MKTYKLFTTKTAPAGDPFEGEEIRIYVESEGGETYASLFMKYGFTALFFSTINEDM